jgi:hypothetical protein
MNYAAILAGLALPILVLGILAYDILKGNTGKSRKDGGRHYVGRSENWNRPRRKEPEC